MRLAAIATFALAACSFRVPGTAAGDDGTPDAALADAALPDAPGPPAAPFAMSGLRYKLPCTVPLPMHNCNCQTGILVTSVQLDGLASQHWMVTVHVRGALEAMGYHGGMQVPNGWYVGGDKNDNGNNFYALSISSPPQTYWLNPGTPTSQRSFRYDYMATFAIDGGATATFSWSGQDGIQWANYDGAGPITFSGVTTTPDPYDGQFAQLDVISAVPQ